MPLLRSLLVMVLTCALCQNAQAGAWPRGKGEGFVSASIRPSWPQDLAQWQSRTPTGKYLTFYLEYGLTERLTLGLDLGRSVSGTGKNVTFLRYPLLDPEARLKASAELGLGKIDGETVLRPGVSLGLGLSSGWLSADGLAEYQVASGKTDLKLDLTWGWNMAKDRKLILQMQSGAPHGGPAFARFAPSVVLPLNKRVQIELGGAWGLSGDTSLGLLIGVWTQF